MVAWVRRATSAGTRQRGPTEHELVGLDQTPEPVVGDLLDRGGRVEQLREHDLERLGAVDVSA